MICNQQTVSELKFIKERSLRYYCNILFVFFSHSLSLSHTLTHTNFLFLSLSLSLSLSLCLCSFVVFSNFPNVYLILPSLTACPLQPCLSRVSVHFERVCRTQVEVEQMLSSETQSRKSLPHIFAVAAMSSSNIPRNMYKTFCISSLCKK